MLGTYFGGDKFSILSLTDHDIEKCSCKYSGFFEILILLVIYFLF